MKRWSFPRPAPQKTPPGPVRRVVSPPSKRPKKRSPQSHSVRCPGGCSRSRSAGRVCDVKDHLKVRGSPEAGDEVELAAIARCRPRRRCGLTRHSCRRFASRHCERRAAAMGSRSPTYTPGPALRPCAAQKPVTFSMPRRASRPAARRGSASPPSGRSRPPGRGSGVHDARVDGHADTMSSLSITPAWNRSASGRVRRRVRLVGADADREAQVRRGRRRRAPRTESASVVGSHLPAEPDDAAHAATWLGSTVSPPWRRSCSRSGTSGAPPPPPVAVPPPITSPRRPSQDPAARPQDPAAAGRPVAAVALTACRLLVHCRRRRLLLPPPRCLCRRHGFAARRRQVATPPPVPVAVPHNRRLPPRHAADVRRAAAGCLAPPPQCAALLRSAVRLHRSRRRVGRAPRSLTRWS